MKFGSKRTLMNVGAGGRHTSPSGIADDAPPEPVDESVGEQPGAAMAWRTNAEPSARMKRRMILE